MNVSSLSARARAACVTSDTGNPVNAAGSNAGLRHDFAVGIHRLKDQIVHALGTQLRVHSSKGQARGRCLFIAIAKSGQSGNTDTRDVQMQDTLNRGICT